MSLEQLWGIGLGTVAILVVLLGMIYFQRVMRNRLLPGGKEKDRGEAMTELFLLQTQLEEKAKRGEGPEEDREPEPGNEGAGA